MLSVFRTNSECIAQSRLILDHSTNQWALLLAAKSLKELLTLFFHTFSGAQTLEIRNYLLNFIANACNNPQVPSFVILALCETTARVAKLGWRQEPTAQPGQLAGSTPPGGPHATQAGGHAAFVETCGTFFQHSMKHHQMGLLLLENLVQEMEQACSVESPSDHRKTSRIFRDHALLDIIRISLSEIRSVGNFVRSGESQQEISSLLTNAIHLFSACMSFDFIGSVIDESASDDSNVILQIPSSWRSLVEDTSATSPALLLAEIYAEFTALPGVQAEVLNAFSCLASVRRSIFTNEESRLNFMKFLQETQITLIQKFAARMDEQNYHEFARFLGRFKYNYSLNELVKSPSFENWLQTLYLFTVQKGFTGWEGGGANSLSYLLGVWSRIAADVSQLKMSDGSSTYSISNTAMLNPSMVQGETLTHKVQGIILELIPKICELFIAARLDSVGSMVRGDRNMGVDDADAKEVWNEIFAEPNLSDQLKYLSVLCRFHYVQMRNYLKLRIEPLIEQYKILLQSLVAGGPPPPNMTGLPHSPANTALQLQVVESQLTMMVYIIGCIVGCEKSLMLLHHPSTQRAHPFITNTDRMTTGDHLQLLDAELISWVLTLLPIMNVRIEKSSETASAGRQLQLDDGISAMTECRSHMAKSVIYFFQEFRKKSVTRKSNNYPSTH